MKVDISTSSEEAEFGSLSINPHIFPTRSYALHITLFFLSCIGLSFGYTMALTTFSFTSIYQGIELLSLLVLVYSLTKLIKVDFQYTYYRMIAFIFFLWQIIILGRGDYSKMDYMGVKQFIFDLNYGGLILFIPIILFINYNFFIVKALFSSVLILISIFTLFSFLNLNVLFESDVTNMISLGTSENYFKYLALPVGILALNINLLNWKSKLLVLFVLFLIVLIGIFRARRGMIFMAVSISFLSGLNFFITSNRKFSVFFYSAYILFGLGLFFLYFTELDFNNFSFFRNISQRGLEDTRSYVEDCFYNDMTLNDWIFGKGFNGGYKCPGIDDSIFKDGIRKVIETDYLQLIMNGGILNLILLFLVMVPAVILGLFYSNNNLIKTFSIWILLWLIFLYPSNVYSLNVFHISIWLSAGICYSKPLRMLPNSFITNYFLVDFKK